MCKKLVMLTNWVWQTYANQAHVADMVILNAVIAKNFVQVALALMFGYNYANFIRCFID